VSYVKTAEPIEMQFGMLSRVGSWNSITCGCTYPYGKRHFGRCLLSSRWKSIAKHRIFGVG